MVGLRLYVACSSHCLREDLQEREVLMHLAECALVAEWARWALGCGVGIRSRSGMRGHNLQQVVSLEGRHTT